MPFDWKGKLRDIKALGWAADSRLNREPAKTENASGKSSVGTGLLIVDRIERLQRLKVAAQERRAYNKARGH